MLSVEHVTKTYGKFTALEDISLTFTPGVYGLLAPNGAGKTTLINLLMRFYDVDKGSIELSGQCIADVTRKSLRSAYGMVLQDTWLKAGTIRDNIKMGREDATDDEMIAAAMAEAAKAVSGLAREAQELSELIHEMKEG